MLGHELRNPLAPIVTSLELMARRDARPRRRERRIIERQVAHLSRLVDDLLDVSRIAVGQDRAAAASASTCATWSRARSSWPSRRCERRAHARPRLTLPDAPVWVDGDPVRLAQVVCNLLTNAAKFSRARAARSRSTLRRERATARSSRVERRGRRHRRRSCCRTSSSASCRASRRCSARAAASASAWRSRKTWSSCTAARSPPRATGPGRGSRFTVRCRRRAAAGCRAPLGRAPPARPARAAARARRRRQRRRGAVARRCSCALEGHEVRSAGRRRRGARRCSTRFAPERRCSTSACRDGRLRARRRAARGPAHARACG